MKKIILIVTSLLVCSFAAADVTVTVDSSDTWIGYMNVFDTSMAWQWGSGWGTPDLRANYSGPGPNPDLYLQANTNVWNPADPYWVLAGVGNKIMEANYFQEFFGLAGQTLTFNYTVLSNNLAASGYTTIGFVKVLDPDSGWATVQSTTMVLNSGAVSLPLTEDGTAITPVMQAGFTIMGLNVSPISTEASQAVFVDAVPEPATIAILSLGGLFLLRRRATK